MRFFKNNKKVPERVYLDHASSTPIERSVLERMRYFERSVFGNPSAIHDEGVGAARVLNHSRMVLARALSAHDDEIFFTSGGTEGDNIALLGVVNAAIENGVSKPHVIVSEIEHAAILEPAKALQKRGVIQLTLLSVNEEGIVMPENLKELLTPETVLVSVMHANNEIGTVQPIREITKEVRHYRKHVTKHPHYPLVHTDACQSFVYIPIKVEELGVDLLTVNGSKLYGPKGVGALFIKRGTPVRSVLFGGDQEALIRPGTENVPAIGGFGVAVEVNERLKESEAKRLRLLMDETLTDLSRAFPDCIINGSKTDRLPNNINITLPGFLSETLVVYLNAKGFAVSEKSACKADEPGTSHVIAALRKYKKDVSRHEEGSIRISMGRSTTKKMMNNFVKALISIVQLQKSVT